MPSGPFTPAFTNAVSTSGLRGERLKKWRAPRAKSISEARFLFQTRQGNRPILIETKDTLVNQRGVRAARVADLNTVAGTVSPVVAGFGLREAPGQCPVRRPFLQPGIANRCGADWRKQECDHRSGRGKGTPRRTHRLNRSPAELFRDKLHRLITSVTLCHSSMPDYGSDPR